MSRIKSISFQFVWFHFIYLLHIYLLVYFSHYTGEFLICTNANIIFFCGSRAIFITHVISIFIILSRTQLYRVRNSKLKARKGQKPVKPHGMMATHFHVSSDDGSFFLRPPRN